MKYKALIISIFLSNAALAHKDFCKSFTEKNVTSRIMTGYNFEIINQTELIGNLVSKLSAKLEYKHPIFIDFMHDYIGEHKACTYAVGFNTVYQCGDDLENNKEHGDILFSNQVATISIVGSKYEVQEILMLVQALLQNPHLSTSEFKCANQSVIHHWKNLKSIDQSSIEEILTKKVAGVVESILSDSIYLPSFQVGRLAYYWQNGNFYLQEKKWSYSSDSYELSTIDTLSNIVQLTRIGNAYFIFENDSTFKFVEKSSSTFMSKPVRLEQQSDVSFRPYEIYEISNDRYSINAKGRVSLFIYNRHEGSIDLVLDLYEKINKN